MNGPAQSQIDKSTVISIGVAICLASVVFLAGAIYTKVDRLDGLKIETRLSRIEAILERESRKASTQSRDDIPDRNALRGDDQGEYPNQNIMHIGIALPPG